jgi:hypothetical protein
VVFDDFDGTMDGGMITGLQAGYLEDSNEAPLTGDFRCTWESMNMNNSITFDTGADALEYGNAYFYWIMDGNYDMATFIIQVPVSQAVNPYPFTPTPGAVTALTEDGYSYTPWGAPAPVSVDLYTVTVPLGTTALALDFGAAETLSYNYDAAGNYIAGEYDDATVGESTTTKPIDADGDGVNDYIWVQAPYNPDWSGGDLQYVIRTVYSYTFTVRRGRDAHRHRLCPGQLLLSGLHDAADLHRGDVRGDDPAGRHGGRPDFFGQRPRLQLYQRRRVPGRPLHGFPDGRHDGGRRAGRLQ